MIRLVIHSVKLPLIGEKFHIFFKFSWQIYRQVLQKCRSELLLPQTNFMVNFLFKINKGLEGFLIEVCTVLHPWLNNKWRSVLNVFWENWDVHSFSHVMRSQRFTLFHNDETYQQLSTCPLKIFLTRATHRTNRTKQKI